MMKKATTGKARELRSNQSAAEKLFWSKVRNRQLGWKFKRQVPIGPYIADFYVDEVKAVIELDGDQHGRDDYPERDLKRTSWFEEHGYAVKRIWNYELYEDAQATLDGVFFGSVRRMKRSSSRTPHPEFAETNSDLSPGRGKLGASAPHRLSLGRGQNSEGISGEGL